MGLTGYGKQNGAGSKVTFGPDAAWTLLLQTTKNKPRANKNFLAGEQRGKPKTRGTRARELSLWMTLGHENLNHFEIFFLYRCKSFALVSGRELSFWMNSRKLMISLVLVLWLPLSIDDFSVLSSSLVSIKKPSAALPPPPPRPEVHDSVVQYDMRQQQVLCAECICTIWYVYELYSM